MPAAWPCEECSSMSPWKLAKRSIQPSFALYDGKVTALFQRPETMTEHHKPTEAPRRLTPAAERALAEAEARRKTYREAESARPKELGGRGGKEPVRYGDWEVKGLASDF